MSPQTLSNLAEAQSNANGSSRARHDQPPSSSERFRSLTGSYPRTASSSVGMIHILSYAPPEGEQSVPITANFSCKGDLGAGIHIRLVVGRRAVSTKVRELEPIGYGRWQLEAAAPPFAKQQSVSTKVPLTVQAVNKENVVLDSVTFGDFTYWESVDDCDGHTTSLITKYTNGYHTRNAKKPPSLLSVRLVSETDQHSRTTQRAGPYDRSRSPVSPSDSEHASSSRTQQSSGRSRSHALRRTRHAFEVTEANMQNAILEIMTPLDGFCHSWDDSELQAGRRLVRFHRMQDGNKLMVSAERIGQDEYSENDIVISCIYRDETDSCCVTSVDIIHLLQRLVDADFEVDEKNRIRRNLEGLRPTTVSKSRPGSEGFFQRIMDFPDPKPRKIEKDLKVFDWKLLPQALEKIISKYSLYTSPISTPPKEESPAPGQIPCAQVEAGDSVPEPEDQQPRFFSSYGEALQIDPSQDSHSPQSSQFEQHSQTSQFEQSLQPITLGGEVNGDNMLYPEQQEQYRGVYVDPEVMNRYYPAPTDDELYGVHSNIPPHEETVYSAPIPLAVSAYVAEQPPSSNWALQQPEGGSTAAYDFESGSFDTGTFHTFDSLEFQTLREHSMSAALAG